MGRKKGKRQCDPSRDDAESTDTEAGGGDTEGAALHAAAACPHVGRAVQLANIKKSLKVAWVRVGQCSQCFKDQQAKSPSSVQLKRVKNEVLRRELGGKLTPQEIKRLQLERAKAEREAAAKNLKNLRENITHGAPQEAPAPVEEKTETPSVEEAKLPEDVAVAETPSCWLCMRCGSQGCDNSSKKHSLGHYSVPRSDLHCLIVNTDNWVIWCYECRAEISVDTHKKLYEVVELIKKTKEQPVNNNPKSMSTLGTALVQYSKTGPAANNSSNVKSQGATGQSSSATKSSKSSSNGPVLPRVKGLSNLGNTCFFNSVMQCLSQTHVLTELLDLQVSQGVNFSISGTSLSVTDESEAEAGAANTMRLPDVYSDLSVKLAEGGPMVTSLAAFFKDMLGGGKSSVVNPGHVFGQVARQSPKFRGMQQQDSHELLRYLMDGLKNEESKRQKSAVLKYFGLSEKSDPKNVANHLKRKLQAYGRESNHTLLDRIFSGQMVSTIVCEVCHHSSHTYEQFLDLSLPVVEDKPVKPHKVKRQSGLISDDGQVSCCGSVDVKKKSKGQIKKERQRKKIEGRKKKKYSKNSKEDNEDEVASDGDQDGEEKITEELKESEESEKSQSSELTESKDDVEHLNSNKEVDDNDSSENLKGNATEGRQIIDKDDGSNGEWGWDYGEPWEDKQSLVFKKVQENADSTEDTSDYIETDFSPVQLVSVKSLPESDLDEDDDQSSVGDSSSNEDDNETGASSNGDIEDNDSNVAEERQERPWVMSKNLLNNLQKLDTMMNTAENCDPRMQELCRSMSTMRMEDTKIDNQERTRLQWTGRTLTTLAPRHQTSADECSVYSCLNSFTQSELLTGSNKWACDSCTRMKATGVGDTSEDASEDKKEVRVYSPASKQFLVFCPPAILTLHLKRFQQTLSGCKKVNKHVSFPLVLDLASYCSATSLAMPSVALGQAKVLYSLYGCVEHSGGLQGGHYTAFVRVRPANTHADSSAFFAPSISKASDIPKFLDEIESKVKSSRHRTETPEEAADRALKSCDLPKRWYHVSDSSVSEVAEERVLKCQAYLLFYERIL